MTTLSTRYVVPLLALLVPAFVAVWVYSCGGFRSDDCADPSALSETAWIAGLERRAEPEQKRLRWLLQDIGGTIATRDSGIGSLEFRIVRSFDLERLRGNPLRFFLRRGEFASYQPTLEWIGGQGDELPIYEIIVETPRLARVAAYMFLYDSRPVVNPSPMSFSAALQRIATGHRPLTLVTVSVISLRPLRGAAEELAEDWLASAWAYYRSVCRP